LTAALLSAVLRVPAYLGTFAFLACTFACGVLGMRHLARRAGLGAPLSIALGFLYAAGPYMSLDLFKRMAYPEYAALQLAPMTIVCLSYATSLRAGVLVTLLGAAALSFPTYVHKLVGPFIVLAALAVIVCTNRPSLQ